MSETNLRAALDNHLYTMPGLPDVDWLGNGLSQTGQVYYSVDVLPAEDIRIGISATGTNMLAGIYQITISVPKGTGKSAYMVEIEKLRDRFKRSQTLTYGGTVVSIQACNSAAAITDESYLRIPISVRYRAAT